MLLVQSLKDYWWDWRTLRLEDEWRPSKQHYHWERPESWEESWRLGEICCYLNFGERPSANGEMKNYQGVNNYNINNNIVNFAVPDNHRVKLKESEKKENTSTLLGKWKKCGAWKWRLYQLQLCFLYRHQRIIKGTGELGNRTSGEHSNYYTIETSQNT